MTEEQREILKKELDKLHQRHELADQVGPDYFEPGMMEYLDKSEGIYDEVSGEVLLRFESKGTRYNGRTEAIENVADGDAIQLVREPSNAYNANNFLLITGKGHDVGNMPAELCNAIAPIYDQGEFHVDGAKVSYVEPISKRSRHAKQAMLFVEVRGRISSKDKW